MNNSYYNRYKSFFIDGESNVVPFVKLPKKTSDIQYQYRKNITRLDKLSQEYYGSPYYSWLIMLANPKYGGLEWNIPDKALITIPYPLVNSLQDYENELNNYFFYYGR